MIRSIFKYLIKGLVYSVGFGIVGVLFSMFKGWHLLKGAYIFVLGAGLITSAISAVLLIGTPKMRKEYFVRKNKEDFDDPTRGGEGIAPALMGIVMIIIGFTIEAMMH
ncbi:hypothetical protein [Paramaledivibacter caminithermalis]|jgi:hypothetical protein|uniref:Uncharacterized protein n=1 Tax=Paramaledivibacter caminithermalis (strain DSM 15212 / CIP 107654 / DViRD3) TaxID=1121301 RepID=A0A1M6QM83_PARC5|nr:hypothetical protein [Paramaledivibacter caminithermalis]SHK21275.1 hypothetical protein SAMN02745912_02632 [Paramaledivibacter caminithermalis DSM 15212]